MHKYLKAIGYGNIDSRKKLNRILKDVEEDFSCHEIISMEEELDFCEYQKECGAGIGISVCGTMDLNESFEREYYYPYFIGSGVSSYADVMVEKRTDRDAYIGICEDVKMGVSLIFSLQNGMDYMRECQLSGKAKSGSLTLSGLCNSGTILFPVMKSKEQERRRKEESRNRMMLLSAARNGDQTAMESLTLDDMDIYSQVTRRLITEDIFSIVDTYFMPYGVECDIYSIMGEILEIGIIENEDTKEELYVLKLDVNEVPFDVCVPVKDVFGEPARGRRFKGNIWLQGRINF